MKHKLYDDLRVKSSEFKWEIDDWLYLDDDNIYDDATNAYAIVYAKLERVVEDSISNMETQVYHQIKVK